MSTRRDRLKKLVKVQEQLKALHETRHATFLAAAASAEAEARDLVGHFDRDNSLSGLFPDLYHRRIAQAVAYADWLLTERGVPLRDAAEKAFVHDSIPMGAVDSWLRDHGAYANVADGGGE